MVEDGSAKAGLGRPSSRREPQIHSPVGAAIVGLSWGLLAFSLVAVLLALGTDSLERQISASSVALAAYLAALLVFIFGSSKNLGLFDAKLGSWFLAYAVLAFGVATSTIVQVQTGSLASVDKSLVPFAMVLIALGFTAWAAGYLLGRAQVWQKPFRWGKKALSGRLSQEVRTPAVIVGVFVLGLVADVTTIALEGRYGYLGDATTISVDSVAWYTQPLVILSTLKRIALFALAVRVFVTCADKFSRYLLPALVFTLGIGLLTGMKETFVLTLLSVAVPFFLGRSRGRMVATVGAVLIFMFVVTPLVAALRVDVRGQSGQLDVLSALAAGIEGIFSTDGYLTKAEMAPDGPSTLERTRLIDNLALILAKTPHQIPYRPFDELITAPVTGLIPRLVWPDKPVRISGYEFYVTYYGGTAQSSSAVTLQGSLYLYGGVAILLVGMLIVGMVIRALDDVLNVKRDMHGALFFILVASAVVKQEQDVAGLLASIPIHILTWIIGANLIFHKSGVGISKRRRVSTSEISVSPNAAESARIST